ncbi:hypothetical protein Tco_0039405 [Tanacetum coccineum]
MVRHEAVRVRLKVLRESRLCLRAREYGRPSSLARSEVMAGLVRGTGTVFRDMRLRRLRVAASAARCLAVQSYSCGSRPRRLELAVTHWSAMALIDQGVAAVMAEAEASRVRNGYNSNGAPMWWPIVADFSTQLVVFQDVPRRDRTRLIKPMPMPERQEDRKRKYDDLSRTINQTIAVIREQNTGQPTLPGIVNKENHTPGLNLCVLRCNYNLEGLVHLGAITAKKGWPLAIDV